MFERFNEAARRALFFARYEASLLGGRAIETEHLLAGLIREDKGLVPRILSQSQVSRESLLKEIGKRAISREKISTSVEIPFSTESQRVLQFTMEEADRLRHDEIRTEHMLLGLMREQSTVAASVLIAHGLQLDDLRNMIVKLLADCQYRRRPRCRTPLRRRNRLSASNRWSIDLPPYLRTATRRMSWCFESSAASNG